MSKKVLGILAHVDAGKTTLSEAILYSSGVIKSLGRVDNKNSFLDSNEMERNRGITIFSKQAVCDIGSSCFTLLDTPGHVDFSAEMERTLQVLDYAILVISASDGVQGHTKTLWRLLAQYNIPVFIFVNKMDQPDNHKDEIMKSLMRDLNHSCVDFSVELFGEDIMEKFAVEYADYTGDESFLDKYLEDGELDDSVIRELISHRLIFPCYFGSALKLDGIDTLLDGLDKYTLDLYNGLEHKELGGRVYKITRDSKDERLVHLKLTSGVLKVRDKINDEKINQIRIYNGDKFETVNEVYPGDICSITGVDSISAGQGIGINEEDTMPLLEPVISYQIIMPAGVSSRQMYPKLKQLEEELPELSMLWDEDKEEIKVKLMGQVQIEVLSGIIKKRYGFIPEFGLGSITYKETVGSKAIGVGHFEPLRHYAEVHLMLEPGERGSGITIDSQLSEDILDKNWQRLIKTHVLERTHRGVLTGGALTDVKVTLINGKAHLKHTEGGDFRQATYRAIRNGLMYSDNIILEPYYNFELIVPNDMVGKAMLDIENMYGTMNPPELNGDIAFITGRCPVKTMRDYQVNVNAYTKGRGSLSVTLAGYDVCHNQEQVIKEIGYNPDDDVRNPSSSVFCTHGAGFVVPWHEVRDYMHLSFQKESEETLLQVNAIRTESFDYSIGTDEIDAILGKTYNANIKTGKHGYKKKREADYFDYSRHRVSPKPKEKVYIVDGYNVIFAWKELKELSQNNIDSAKDKLIAVLSEFKAIVDKRVILVFDGYKVKGNLGSEDIIQDISVIHTRENETADAYIERFANSNKDKLSITVVTSDSLIRQLAMGSNCMVISSQDFEKEVEKEKQALRDTYKLD